MKLGRTTKIRQNFFFIIFLLSLLSEQQKFGRIFLCLRLIQSFSIPVFPLFMVQPVSAILILICLGFRFYSRQSIIYGSTRPPSFSLFVPAHCASSTSSSYSSFHLVCCFDILSRLFRFLMAFYSLPFGVSCCVPHCRFDSWLYLSRCYVTVGWRSQQNFTLYCSVVRLGQSSVSVFLLSCRNLRASSSFPVNRLPFPFVFVFVFVNVSTVSPLSFHFFTTGSL